MSIGGKLKSNINVKARLSTTLKSWLPILQSGLTELEETLNAIAEENPYANVQSQMLHSLPSKNHKKSTHNTLVTHDGFESTYISEKSLYEVLEEQIVLPLFLLIFHVKLPLKL